MKTLIAAALLLALIVPAHAVTCTGRVKNDVTTNELYPKGTKLFSVGDCAFTQPAHEKRILRTCPMGSRCLVAIDGHDGPDGEIENVLGVIRLAATPYRQGMYDYRAGLCYRARPYPPGADHDLWERGYHAGAKKYPKRDMSHCHPRSLIKEDH